MNVQLRGAVRTRWAAIGAAVAISVGGGGIAITQAAVSSGPRSVFMPIAPCRVFDTRSGDSNVGPRSTPIAAGETYTQQITGANGNCTTPIPADATAVAMNVTAVGGTAASFLTIWPSDVIPRPLVSSLNWTPSSPPTPNKVDTKLSPIGQINLFNNSGAVDILADIVGYYTDHNHDDRYYPRAETYNKTETYAKADVYNKAETYAKDDVYNKSETDSVFTTKAAVAAAPYSHVVAGGLVFSSGTLYAEESFGNLQTSHLGTGLYQVTLTGYSPGCATAALPFLTATLMDLPAGFVVSNGGISTDCLTGNTSMFVHTAALDGTAADRNFIVVVYVDG